MPPTLTEQIYKKLRNDIITLRMKPGEKVSEAKLAKLYKVSRAPIRNVIQRLQEEELVIVKPQAGTIIMPISLKRAKDILEVRRELETYAAGVAAEWIGDDTLGELDAKFAALHDDLDDAPAEERARCLFETDTFLHQTIWRVCGNEEIIRILNTYRDSIHRIRLATLELANRRAPSIDEMTAILAALRARDPQAARKAMHEHLTNITRSMERVITQNGE